ncbi:MAG: helix-turn-helix domain-containing protein [Treponema sp.]|nr:helix-turn-helix domain-containing protein [Treponema sp.]
MTGKTAPAIRGELLKPAEVARKLRVSAKLVYNMASAQELPSHRVRSGVRFDSADVDDYLFLSKFGDGNVRLRPSDAEELLRRLDERHASDMAYIKTMVESAVKRRGLPMR